MFTSNGYEFHLLSEPLKTKSILVLSIKLSYHKVPSANVPVGASDEDVNVKSSQLLFFSSRFRSAALKPETSPATILMSVPALLTSEILPETFETFPSSHTQPSDVAVTTNLINDEASNRAMISSKAERSLPWIPVIGLVSPEESVLFKKLVETSNCSSNENTSIHSNKITNSAVPREEEQESAEIELIDRKSNNENNASNEDSDKMDITKNENKEESTNENINDEDWKEIFNNSILLDKIMQQWREALNQQAELIAQHSQTQRPCSLTFSDPIKYASSGDLENQNPLVSSTSKRLKKSRNGTKNWQGTNLQYSSDRHNIVAIGENESDDSKNSDTDDAELSFQSGFKNVHASNHLSIHNVSVAPLKQHNISSHDDLPNSNDNTYHVQFDSEGIFNLEENSEISSMEGTLPNVGLDTNCNGAEIQYSTTKPTLEHYTACIRANFQGFITFTTHDDEVILERVLHPLWS
jgi:hypothetical protein